MSQREIKESDLEPYRHDGCPRCQWVITTDDHPYQCYRRATVDNGTHCELHSNSAAECNDSEEEEEENDEDMS